MAQSASDIMAVGTKLVELCRAGKHLDAIDQLYSNDIVSMEAAEFPGMERIVKGIDAVRGKNQWWLENHEVHSSTLAGPFAHGNDRFATYSTVEITPKAGPMAGNRMTMEEVSLYTVNDGKVTKEEFFYSA